jgi:hypothetical protein
VPTLAYLLTLGLATQTASAKAHGAPLMTAVAMLTAGAVDFVRAAMAHKRFPDLVCVERVGDAHAVGALRAALGAEGIDARPLGMAVFSLLQPFGAFAPVELHVPAEDADRATALLQHWLAGAPKPQGTPESAPAAPPRSGGSTRRALFIAGLGAVVVLVDLAPPPGRPPSVPRARIEIVRVDDEADPLFGVIQDDAPETVTLYRQSVPLGTGRSDKRNYARAVLRPGESLEAAWARLLPWLQRYPLPAGRRWAYEAVQEAQDGEDPDEDTKVSRVVGLRSIVLAGDAEITTADIEGADVRVDADDRGPPDVDVTLSPDAGERFYALTREWVGRRLAIMLNGVVDSAPVVRTPIRGGHVSVTVSPGPREKQIAEARALAASLR